MCKKEKKVVLGFFVIILTLSLSPSFSFALAGDLPTVGFNRTTGLINIPRPDILPHGGWIIKGVGTSAQEEEKTEFSGAFNMGLFDLLEAGVMSKEENVWAGNIQLRILKEDFNLPALVVGIQNIEEDTLENSSLYLVLGKTDVDLPLLGRTNLYLGFGDIGSSPKYYKGETDLSKDLNGLLFALEKKIHPTWSQNPVSFILEGDGRGINTGIEFLLSTGIGIHAALTRLTTGDPMISLGLSFGSPGLKHIAKEAAKEEIKGETEEFISRLEGVRKEVSKTKKVTSHLQEEVQLAKEKAEKAEKKIGKIKEGFRGELREFKERISQEWDRKLEKNVESLQQEVGIAKEMAAGAQAKAEEAIRRTEELSYRGAQREREIAEKTETLELRVTKLEKERERLAQKLDTLLKRVEETKKELEKIKLALPKKKTEHVVKKGECLWIIASYPETYGDPFKWRKIYEANRDKIKNPDLIYPGQRLIIP